MGDIFHATAKKVGYILIYVSAKTQEVRHGLKPGFAWGIVSKFKHYSSNKIKITGLSLQKSNENITDLENLIYG